MYLFSVFACICEGINKHLVLPDGSILDGFVDLHQVLVDDSAGTDVQVTHLRVPHLSFGKTNVFTRGMQMVKGVFIHKPVHIRCRYLADHIRFCTISNSPAIEDHEECLLFHTNNIFNNSTLTY